MITDLTIGSPALPDLASPATATVTDTENTILTNLANAQTSAAPTSVGNRDRDLVVTAVASNGVMTLTAIYYGSTFTLSFPGLQFPSLSTDNNLGNIATIVNVVPTHSGSGSSDQARLFQQAGDEYKGVTTQYPEQGAQPPDYGQPNDFVALECCTELRYLQLQHHCLRRSTELQPTGVLPESVRAGPGIGYHAGNADQEHLWYSLVSGLPLLRYRKGRINPALFPYIAVP